MSGSRSVNEIPVQYQNIFFPIKIFNQMQSEVFDDVTKSDKHIVVSAPTASGKTIIFELAIVELLIFLDKINYEKDKLKIIYVAPTKALCNEVFHLWQKKFEINPHNLKLVLLTGDSDPEIVPDFCDLAPFQMVITTPEKWDVLTRKWRDHPTIAAAIKLFLIDEVHLVGDEHRGPTLEAIMSRIKSFRDQHDFMTHQSPFGMRHTRIVAVSASLPNIDDVGNWIGSMEPPNAVKIFRIPEDWRPVKLERFVCGYPNSSNSYQFDGKLNYELSKIANNLVRELSAEKPILIFCQSRKSVEMALNQLQKDVHLPLGEMKKIQLKSIAESFQDVKLRSSVLLGFAFHHAGLTHEDRKRVERTYKKGLILILLSTSTLAMGVNLPAHTVIIKSTEAFVAGNTKEIPECMILQMMGRAGRPQYDSCGRVIIMTQEEKVRKYETLVSGTIPIDSELRNKMAEHLNTEIALHTVTDIDFTALQWIRSTFLYTRAVSTTAAALGAHVNDGHVREAVEKELKDLCLQQIQNLRDIELISALDGGGSKISSTPFGQIMARFYLSIDTMKTFRTLCGNESIVAIFDWITKCTEFTRFYLRVSEKKILNSINTGLNGRAIRFPIGGKITNLADKVSCLLQVILGQIPVDDAALYSEALEMLQVAERMAFSLIEYFRNHQFSHGNFNAILSAAILAKCFKIKQWDNTLYVSGILPEISVEDSYRLADAGLSTIDSLLEADPRQIEKILQKKPQFGQTLINSIAQWPRYKIQIVISSSKIFHLCVMQTNANYKVDGTMDKGMTLLVGDSTNQLLLYNEQIQYALSKNGKIEFQLSVSKSTGAQFLVAYLLHHHFVGIDQMVQVQCMIGARAESTTFSSNIYSRNINENNNKNNNNSSSCKQIDLMKNDYCRPTASIVALKSQSIENFFKKVSKTQSIVDDTPEMDLIFDLNFRKKSKRDCKLDSLPSNEFRSPEQHPLYDFGYENTQSTLSTISKSRNSHNKDINPNQFAISNCNGRNNIPNETPISKKIGEQMAVANKPSDGGFVTAKSIFTSNGPATSKPSCNFQTERTKVKQFPLPNIYFEKEVDASPLSSGSIGYSSFPGSPTDVPTNIVDSTSFMSRPKLDISRSISSILNREYTCPTNYQFSNDFDDPASDAEDDFNKKCQQKHSEKKPVRGALHPCFLSVDGHGTSALNRNKNNEPSTSTKFGVESTLNRSTTTPLSVAFNYQYKQPQQMQPSTSKQSSVPAHFNRNGTNTKTCHFTPADSPILARKKTKLSLLELMANGLGQHESQQQQRGCTGPRTAATVFSDVQLKSKQPITKTSLNTVLGRITRSPKTKWDSMDAAKVIEQCKNRLYSDENYTKKDYDVDFVRYKILMMPVKNPTLLPVEPSNPNQTCVDVANNTEFKFIDDQCNDEAINDNSCAFFDFSSQRPFL